MIGLFWLRVKTLIVKELIQGLRDPRLRFLMVGPPILQLLAFGYAANLDLTQIPIAIYDDDRSTVSRELAFAFSSSGYFTVKAYVDNPRDMTETIDRGKVSAALHFGRDLARNANSGRTGEVQVIVSGTNSNTAALVQSYALQIVQRYNQSRLKLNLERQPILASIIPAGAGGILRPEVRVWYNEDLTTRNFYVPGVIAQVILIGVLNLTAMAVVREKEVGTMEQILVTPIRPIEFIIGKSVPSVMIGFFQAVLVTIVGVFWFDVPMRGSILMLFVSLMIYLLSSLSLGLLISTVSRTQQQAMMTTFLFLFPAIMLSGFIFPIENMPAAVQWITYVNPLRYFLVVIRGIFLKGVGLEVLWPQLAALLALGLALMVVAVKRVGKTID